MDTNLIALRRYDAESESYVTYYINDRKKKGCFHRLLKENFNDTTTTIKVTKDEIYEVRIIGGGWKNVGLGEFRLWLAAFNATRIERGWEPIALSS